MINTSRWELESCAEVLTGPFRSILFIFMSKWQLLINNNFVKVVHTNIFLKHSRGRIKSTLHIQKVEVYSKCKTTLASSAGC